MIDYEDMSLSEAVSEAEKWYEEAEEAAEYERFEVYAGEQSRVDY